MMRWMQDQRERVRGSGEVRVAVFAVAPGDDEAFLAAWAEHGTGTLHRALRRDADFRFAATGGAGAPPGFPADAGEYDIAHEDGGVDGARGGGRREPLRGARRMRASTTSPTRTGTWTAPAGSCS